MPFCLGRKEGDDFLSIDMYIDCGRPFKVELSFSVTQETESTVKRRIYNKKSLLTHSGG